MNNLLTSESVFFHEHVRLLQNGHRHKMNWLRLQAALFKGLLPGKSKQKHQIQPQLLDITFLLESPTLLAVSNKCEVIYIYICTSNRRHFFKQKQEKKKKWIPMQNSSLFKYPPLPKKKKKQTPILTVLTAYQQLPLKRELGK